MKILYLHQYFKTPQDGGAIRSYYLAKGLVEHGHTVEMISSWNQSHYERKLVEGIIVHYLPIAYDNKMGFIRRIRAFLLFQRKALQLAIKIKDADLCYATSTPLTVGLLALSIKKRTGLQYYFEVRDLWPEAPIQLGILKNPILKWLATRWEKKIYEGADKIVALSPGIRLAIQKIVPHKSISLVTNVAECEFYQPYQKTGAEDFIVSYIGACGKVNKLERFLEVAREGLHRRTPVRFRLMGEGSELARLRILAEKMQLNNLTFVPFGDKEAVKAEMDLADALYVSFDEAPILQTNSPNKYFDGLAAGKLIVLNIGGWLSEMAEQHQFGFYANPHFPAEFWEKLAPFLYNRKLLQQRQQNARDIAEQYFSKQIQLQKLLKLIDKNQKGFQSNDEIITLTA